MNLSLKRSEKCMKSFELLPTEENLIKTMEMNLLKRNRDLIQFYNLLLLQEGPCAIALDGRWGSGKTFFVKQTKMCIRDRHKMVKTTISITIINNMTKHVSNNNKNKRTRE